MSKELRKTVAKAIHDKAHCGFDYWDERLPEADAAITAATPLIEAALIERLRKRALASDGSRQAGPGEYWLTGREQAKVLLALFDADDPTSDARPGEGVGDE